MKNKLFIAVVTFISIAFFYSQKLSAQVTSESNSSWIELTSYTGSTTYNAFRFSINLSGKNINYPNWSLVVRANPPITNPEGKIFDPTKISIRINQVTGGPTLADLGANQTPIPLSFNDKHIINRSSFPLRNGPEEYYKKYTFDFDVLIEGGSYLENLKTWSQYILSLTFSVLGANDKSITQSSPQVFMQIYPTGTPPSEPTYGIQVNSNARNGLLEFKTITDYVNGVSQTYQNGLSVTSNTGYAVQVRSLKTNFEAGTHILPVSAVSLEIKDPNNSAVGGTISLSGNDQTVFNATNSGTQPRLFNLRYFTQPNDERMLNAKPASYETTLVYTLAPQ
ncbi:MAG: hypothetical protein PHI32_07200 [Dysgonamonadaceae bacterium]|nr:hypothetical protein [Dysgonamonadaceae bacterium]MDD4728194.1 hypothetical protein [Dysgonamonadaceae bacterium]